MLSRENVTPESTEPLPAHLKRLHSCRCVRQSVESWVLGLFQQHRQPPGLLWSVDQPKNRHIQRLISGQRFGGIPAQAVVPPEVQLEAEGAQRVAERGFEDGGAAAKALAHSQQLQGAL